MSISLAPTVAPARPAVPSPLPSPAVGLKLAGLGGLLVWAYLPMLRVFFDKWCDDPQYQHGFLVPFFSGFLLWKAWQAGPLAAAPRPVVGFALLGVALAIRLAAAAILFQQLDALSFLICLAAASLVVGGLPLLKRTGPAILFLIFMIPLPYELERNVGQPLKTAATISSTFLLQTCGQPAIRDGNLILIDDVRLGVVDACSGLKMMMTFAAFSIGAAILMRRTRFEKFLVVLGIIPIAVLANVLRITATGLSHVYVPDKATVERLHDLYGLFMIVVGLALLGVELWALKRLVVDEAGTGNGERAPGRPAFGF